MEMSNFVRKFHNLPGRTLPEKQKNINILLKDMPSDHDALLAAITPKTHFEHLLKLQILLHLKRVPDLVEILKREEEYLPTKLLENQWFCQKLASMLDEDSSNFVNGVLPFTSYVTRKRIIKKLSTYGTRLDLVFDEVCVRYGIYIAKELLSGCTSSKIEEVLKNQKVILSPYHQKLLYQRHPQLFSLYITQVKERNVDSSVIHDIARHDLDTFLELMEKFQNLDTDLGKRLTKRLITGHKDLVMTKPETFSRILHLKTVFRILPEEDFKEFFLKCCPSNPDNLKYGGSLGFTSLRKILGKRYYQLLSEAMTEKYKKDIYDFPDLISEEMMEGMNVEEREKWITIKKKKGVPENDLIPFMKISDSIPLIQQKINLTSSVNGREELMRLLVKTCKINNDYNALAEVVEYVCSRHKNDASTVLKIFLRQIESFFPLELFGDRLWESINSLMKILKRKGEEFMFQHEFYIKYIEFLFRQKKLTDERIISFLKSLKLEHFKCTTTNKELYKMILLKSIDIIPKILKRNSDVTYEDLKLIILIEKWNKDYPEDKISVFQFPRLVESLKKAIKFAIDSQNVTTYYQMVTDLSKINTDVLNTHEISNRLGEVLENIICTKEESELRTETIKNYFLLSMEYFNFGIDCWLLKHQPEIMHENVEQFLEHMFHHFTFNTLNQNLLNYIKKYTDSSFQEKIVTHCLNIIKEKKLAPLDLVLSVLAILEPPNKFLEHVTPFIPTEDTIEGTISESIPHSFKFASTPVLPVLIQFCKGDYKHDALESLYYLFLHSPENQLGVFIEDLSTKAVSVRKHAIFLTCIVGSVENVKKLLKQFIENEKNASVQKHIFTATLKYFIKNPSDDFWDFVKICMTKLDKNDSESFNMLANLPLIPEKYQTYHVIHVWEILKKHEDLNKNRGRLVSSIPSSLYKDFPLEFLLEVISENFLRSGISCETTINDFVVASLTKSSFKGEILDAVFEIINRFKTKKCDSLKEEKISRELLSCFVGSIISTFATGEESGDIFTVFAQKWHSLFSATEAMREHLKLCFLQFYFDSDKDLIKFGTVIGEFLENLVSTYGVVIVDCFATELKDFLKTSLCCYPDFNEDFFKFSLNLLKNFNDLIFYLLAIKLLPSKQPLEEKAAKLFLQVIQILRQVPQESIQMLMNLYVMDME